MSAVISLFSISYGIINKRIKTMHITEIKEILEKNNTYIKETFYVKEIGMFGSFVRGEQKNRSDIDILITFKKGHKDFFNYMRLKSCMEKLFGRKVDLVIKESLKPRLKQRILNEAKYV